MAGKSARQGEGTSNKVVQWLNLGDNGQIIFTHGATSALNLLAYGLEHLFNPGDEIVISSLEHHATLKKHFSALRTTADFFSLRYVRESGQYLSVRKNVAEPPPLSSVTMIIPTPVKLIRLFTCHRPHDHCSCLVDAHVKNELEGGVNEPRNQRRNLVRLGARWRVPRIHVMVEFPNSVCGGANVEMPATFFFGELGKTAREIGRASCRERV